MRKKRDIVCAKGLQPQGAPCRARQARPESLERWRRQVLILKPASREAGEAFQELQSAL